MFDYLSPFEKIIVTGPQRSGTTVCAAMIAHDLDYYFYPEEQIRVWELWRVERLFKRTSEFVLQAPAICRYVHTFSAPEVAIVLVRRDIQDIVASQERVEWTSEERELRQYGFNEGVIAEVKYQYWEEYQQNMIENAFEIDYKSLRAHLLWIPQKERLNFSPRQYQYEEIPA